MRTPITSLVALLATAVLLVADSAGPQCAEYETFHGSFAFESTCGGGVSGDMTLQVGTDSVFAEPLVDLKSSAEGATISNLYADYDFSECTVGEPQGTGRVYAVDFDLQVGAGDTGGVPEAFTCLGLEVHAAGVQLLPCMPYDGTADKCTMTVTPL
jgi:hypothetical protein